jgi:hypothetical protein
MCQPGTYQVSFSKRVNGVITPLGEKQTFQVVAIDGPRPMATLADQQRIADLERSVLGLDQVVTETLSRMTLFKRAVDETPGADTALQHRVRIVTDKLKRRAGSAEWRSNSAKQERTCSIVASQPTERRNRQQLGDDARGSNAGTTGTARSCKVELCGNSVAGKTAHRSRCEGTGAGRRTGGCAVDQRQIPQATQFRVISCPTCDALPGNRQRIAHPSELSRARRVRQIRGNRLERGVCIGRQRGGFSPAFKAGHD